MKEYGTSDGMTSVKALILLCEAHSVYLHLYTCTHFFAAGKLIRESGNPASFNRQASVRYKKLSSQEKVALKARAESQPAKRLSRNNRLREGEKLFKRIQSLLSFIRSLDIV